MPSPDKKPSRPVSPIKKAYLFLYNVISAIAWSVVLYRTLSITSQHSYHFTYLSVGTWTKWTQTMAGLEILHSLLGIVRAPFTTTILQVSSRFLLVWGIVDIFPRLALQSAFYSSMLVAWSVTEVIRYSFFALSQGPGWQPAALTWLRYNTFFVLYPVGITSECALVWLAAQGPAGEHGDVYRWILYAILAVYIPGSYTLYTYMMSQRRKVMRSLKANNDKASR